MTDKRYLLGFRATQGDMMFSCVVKSEGEDELKGEIERRAIKLKTETGVSWVCETVKPFPEPPKYQEYCFGCGFPPCVIPPKEANT